MKKRYISYLVLGAFLVINMSSCLVTREYQRPELETEGLYRTDQILDSSSLLMDEASIAQVSWKNFFSDPKLQDYIQQALDNNLDIRIALKSIDVAEAYMKQAKATYYPSLFGSLDYSHTHNSKNSKLPTRDVDNFGLSANASWEADIWGKLRSQDKAFVANYLQTIEAHKAVKSRLVASIAGIYFQLMALDDQMKIAQRNILTRESTLKTTQALKESSPDVSVTAVAVEQTRAQVYDAQLILLGLKKQSRMLENAFCMLLNESPHQVERGKLNDQEINNELVVGVPSALLVNRPDVRAAEYSLVSAFEMTNIARANFYPSLTLTSATGFQAADIEKWVGLKSIFANAAAGLLQPIFNGKQIRTQYEVAQSQQEQALLTYRKTLLQAGNDVSNALFDIQTQNESLNLVQKQFEANSKAVNFSEQLLLYGKGNYLEVLTANQNSLATELSIVDTKLAHLDAVIDLYQALGGGWQ